MQSILQYRRTGDFVRSRFSEPLAGKPTVPRSNASSMDEKKDEAWLSKNEMITHRRTEDEGAQDILEVGWAGSEDSANPKH